MSPDGNGRNLNRDDAILSLRGVKTYFPIRKGFWRRVVGQVKAVDGVDLDIARGETVGLAGESGCGKTTTIRTIVRGAQPTAGQVFFTPCGEETIDMLSLGHSALKKVRRHIQYVYQDPYGSLDPRMTIMDIVGEPLVIHRAADGRSLRERVAGLLTRVGLNPDHLNRYPHAFSGGQRQRIGVARALALNPQVILLDEPTSALDVSIRAQVINLLMDLQQEFHLTYVVVAHDLALLEHFCDRIAVMFLGQIMEIAPSAAIFANPLHPYTKALLSAVPIADPSIEYKREILQGEPPDPAFSPKGCKFCGRCPVARPDCTDVEPQLKSVGDGHSVRCHLIG